MKKILVIDDDPAILEVVKLILEEENYEVRTSENGKIVNKVDEISPDLILLDVLLSGEDGREIAKVLKNDHATKAIPLVMISAHPSAMDGARDAGADDFIPKPFDIDEFLSIVKKYTHNVR